MSPPFFVALAVIPTITLAIAKPLVPPLLAWWGSNCLINTYSILYNLSHYD